MAKKTMYIKLLQLKLPTEKADTSVFKARPDNMENS